MATSTTRSAPAISRDELLQRARDLVPALRLRAGQAEEMRQMPPETIADLKASGLLEIATPERYGGNGHEIDLMFEAAMEIGRGCGSAAWNYAVWDIHNWMVGHWPVQAQEDYFATGPNTLSSSSFAPNGKLEPVEGGFRLSGRWEFSSGSDGGTWALLGAMSDRGPAFVLVPRPDYTVLQDTWYVSGLKGTGSKDVVVDSAFVPAHRLQPMMGMGPMSGAWQLHQRDSYRLFSMSLLPFTLCSPIVGMARGAIEVFTEELQAKLASSHNGGPPAMGRNPESTAIQLRLAESSAEVDAAIRIIRQDPKEMIERAGAGETLSELDMATYRRNFGYASKLCVQAVNRLFDASGGHGLFADNPMQRFHRDIHAGSHQAALYWDSIGEAYGRVALGLPAQEARRAPSIAANSARD